MPCRPSKTKPPSTSASSRRSTAVVRAAGRDGEHAHALAGDPLDRAAHDLRIDRAGRPPASRQRREHDLGRALQVDDLAASVVLVQRRHELALGLEGDGVAARLALAAAPRPAMPSLCAATTRAPSVGSPVACQPSLLLAHRGVVAERAGADQLRDRRRARGPARRPRAAARPPARSRCRSGGSCPRASTAPAPSSRCGSACRSCRCRSRWSSPASPPPAACG